MEISYSRTVLSNGLTVIFHQDKTTPMAAMNVLYNVGARDEHPDRTGFAHLFEHLMFGGSKNIPSYDEPLQKAGGENNAFTNNDITNYYLQIPSTNIETGFWLESDRMLELAFSERSLDVQRKVVIEEFNQRYLNQPYGDIPLLMRPLAYKVHPYRWNTIGKDISHIADASLGEVKDFFYKHYNPANAILVVGGDFEKDYIFELSEKWFGPIQRNHTYKRNLPLEPLQTEARRLVVERDVPQDCIIIAFPMCNRQHPDYHVFDMMSDVLSLGNSGRLALSLVKRKQLFSGIEAYISGSTDEGQIVFKGDILPGITPEVAEKAIWDEINLLQNEGVSEYEMQKILNQAESSNVFQNVNLLNKAMNLAHYELLGDAGLINREIEAYRKVTAQQICNLSSNALISEKSSTLIYLSKKS